MRIGMMIMYNAYTIFIDRDSVVAAMKMWIILAGAKFYDNDIENLLPYNSKLIAK